MLEKGVQTLLTKVRLFWKDMVCERKTPYAESRDYLILIKCGRKFIRILSECYKTLEWQLKKHAILI